MEKHLIALSVAALQAGAAPASADIKMGSLYPFSGPLALLGDESARGLEIAVEEINAKGGVQGEKIVLVRGDAVDNNQAIGEARRLISVENVAGIFGSFSSGRAVAASQVSELAGVPYFELGAVADEITDRGLENVYRANPYARDFAQMIVEMLQKKIAPKLGRDSKDLKIAVIYEDSSYGTSVAKHEETFLKEAGLNMVLSQSYPGNTVDMSSLVLDLKSAGADVVLQTSYQSDSVLFLQQANEGGYKPSAIVGAGGGYSLQPTADAVGHDVIEAAYDVDFTQFAVNTSFTPGLEEFVEAYKKKYGETPRSGHSLTNYVGAKVILEALNKVKGFDAAAVKQALSAVDIEAGKTAMGYGFKFDQNNQNERASMMGMQWQDGKLVTVYPDAAAISEIRLPQ
ncbi:amino acid-binding protein [Brucella abortus]|uniref:ABC transporter substrate-binding protein n=1 Tax=Brucella abortus TaxID=235 RepID=A0AAE9LET5_BRUAO|nr:MULTISPECIES: ABC transporter substrate-binding protein [Brucella]ALF31496.1 amino acid-binding protein [Brucella abortus 104M]ASZ87944.1 branched-chain amino acid ABC transporter substrate-binding protein [Brucella abortus]ASZ90893.1 branched-chain amino acid ABC transporter substrate-binding protein [Brucella abortus]ASZ93889.1 branched-chain amino acid ABC transporter substrate-binding protein [Brucella abortus]ASZ99827.1 branched-chain amino acid ABC transporter substrate-binding protei